MTDGRHPIPGCLDAETLAAFMDGRLEPRERAAVEAHMAECEDCYEVWMEAIQSLPVPTMAVAATPARSPRLWTRPWLATAAAIAASLLLVVWVKPDLIPFGEERQTRLALSDLASELDTQYVSAGRFAGFRLGTIDPVRGAANSALSDSAHEAALRVLRLADRLDSASGYAAKGKAALVVGRVDEGVEDLRRAVRLAPATPLIHSDLAAGLLELWKRDQEESVAAEALSAAEDALVTSPDLAEALFNRAAALEALTLRDGAIAAWERYLAVDASSDWAGEARRRLEALRRQALMTAPEGLLRQAADLAVSAPWLVFNHLDAVVYPAIASDGSSSVLALGLSLAEALAAADRDVAPQAILRALTGATSLRAGRCVVDFIMAKRAADAAFESGHFDAASQASSTVRQSAVCATLPTFDADLMTHLVAFSTTGTTNLADLAALQRDAERARYLAVATRAHVLQAIAAHQALRFDESLTLYRQSLALADRSGHAGLRAACRAKLASVYHALGEESMAWRLLVEAFQELPRTTSSLARFQVLAMAMVAADSAGFRGAELALAEELQRQTSGWADPTARIHADLRRAAILASLNPSRAFQALQDARTAIRSVVDPALRASHEGEADLVDGVLATTTDPGHAIQVLTSGINALESANNPYRTAPLLLRRGRALEAAGQIEQARADWRRAIDSIEADRATIKDAERRVSRLGQLWELYEALVTSLRSSPWDGLAALEGGRARELRATLEVTAATPESFRALAMKLPARTTVLAYATLPDRLLIWQMTRQGGLTLTEQPAGRAVLADLADRFLGSHVQRARDASVTLTRLLLPDSLSLGPGAHVVIIPDGPLVGLPFGALSLRDSDSRLIEAAAVVVAPSLVLFDEVSQRPARMSSALVVGSAESRPGDGLPALPRVDHEVEAIGALYGPRAHTLRGAAATKEAMLRQLGNAGVIHFAGHAVAEPKMPAHSRILMAPGRLGASLTSPEIMANSLRPGTLVVLSACSTAIGRVYNGEGALSLARPFLSAGAGGVVGALWPAVDSEAERLLVLFHQFLIRDGVHPAMALAKAQRALIRELPNQRSWQTFTYIGGIPMEATATR